MLPLPLSDETLKISGFALPKLEGSSPAGLDGDGQNGSICFWGGHNSPSVRLLTPARVVMGTLGTSRSISTWKLQPNTKPNSLL